MPKLHLSAAQYHHKHFQIRTKNTTSLISETIYFLLGKIWDLTESNMLVLHFAGRIAILSLKCRLASDSSWPVCLARADPNLLTRDTVWSYQPPRVSTGRGRKTMPASLHASPCLVIFSSYLLARAWPCVVAAPFTKADWT